MTLIIIALCYYAECCIFYYYAECHNAVCRYAECHYSVCRGTEATGPTLEVCAKSCSIKEGTHLTCGLYYKHVTVVNDAFSAVNK